MAGQQPNGFRGWCLSAADRDRLLRQFPPAYPNTVADHVTFSAPRGTPLPVLRSARVVGHADDGQGVQALAVAINGSTQRPDGSTYHMTWSLAPGRSAQESNDLLRAQGWQPVDPIDIHLEPAAP